MNIIRLVFAFILLSTFCFFYRGAYFPTDADEKAWLWLGLSGIVGFTIGDLCFFRALVLVGARTAALIMMTLAPPMAAIAGWFVLDEKLSWPAWAGMVLTVFGVAWVVIERKKQNGGSVGKVVWGGVILAILGAMGQAGGAVISKLGMDNIDPAGATQIRIIFGIAGFALLYTIIGWWPKVIAAFKQSTAIVQISAGSFFGPFLGVTLFQASLKMTSAGISQTIVALVPVIIIPLSMLFFKERVTWGAVLGALVAVSGVALLFLL